MFKKLVVFMAAIITLLSFSPAVQAATATPVNMVLKVDGKAAKFAVPVILQQGTYYGEYRTLLENVGATISLDKKKTTVKAVVGQKSVSMTVNSKSAVVNGKKTTLATPPVNNKGKIMVPVQFMVTNLGSKIAIDAAKKTINITTAKIAAPPVAEKKDIKGELSIAGSTSVQPFSEVLADAFMKTYPKAKITVQGGGSGVGIKSAQDGICDIGSSSRDLKTEELPGLTTVTIAKDGIAIVVNTKNLVDNLTIAQIRDIYAGKIKNWKEVGGKDGKINLISREAGSGTRSGFEEMVMGKDAKVTSETMVQNSTGAVQSTVAGDPNAIGYVSMASVDKSVKAVTVDGVACNKTDILNGKYKISRPFLYITKGEPKGLAKDFIDYVMSATGQSILNKEGVVPVK